MFDLLAGLILIIIGVVSMYQMIFSRYGVPLLAFLTGITVAVLYYGLWWAISRSM